MTLPLNRVADHDVQFNFDEIAKRIVDTGGRQIKLRFGTGTLTFTAGTVSDSPTVTHGFGSTPIAVVANAFYNADGHVIACGISGIGASTFAVTGRTVAGVNLTTTRTFYWIAIG